MVTVPAWHPNFRNFERLPDAKDVRRLIVFNVAAVLIVILLAVYAGLREYRLYVLRSDTEIALGVINANKAASDDAVVMYKRFAEEEKKVLALKEFLSDSKLIVSDFILEVGASLPDAIKLSSIEYKPTAVILRGDIEGASDEASGRAIAYVKALGENSAFKPFESITLANIVRDPATGKMRFEVNLKFKAPPVTKKPGGKK